FSKPFLEQIKLGGEATGTTINPVRISSSEEFEAAFASMEKDRPDAVIVQPSLPSRRAAELALKHRVPAVSVPRWFAEEGGLMSYSARFADLYRKAAVYVDKILKGAQPADLPVEQPTIFELVINLKTAKALGLTVPHVLPVRADKLIDEAHVYSDAFGRSWRLSDIAGLANDVRSWGQSRHREAAPPSPLLT